MANDVCFPTRLYYPRYAVERLKKIRILLEAGIRRVICVRGSSRAAELADAGAGRTNLAGIAGASILQAVAYGPTRAAILLLQIPLDVPELGGRRFAGAPGR